VSLARDAFLVGSCLSWIAAGFIWHSLWRTNETLAFKIFLSAVALLPFVGPFLFYFFLMPPRIPTYLQQSRANYYGTMYPVEPWHPRWQRRLEQKRTVTKPPVRRWRPIQHAALGIALVVLIQYWLTAIYHYRQGDAWAYFNAWGLPVGTFLLLAVLLASSVVWLTLASTVWIWPALKNLLRHK